MAGSDDDRVVPIGGNLPILAASVDVTLNTRDGRLNRVAGPHDDERHVHQHTSVRAGERHKRPLLAAFVVLAVFMVVEVVAGLLTNSLALLSDAGHMVTDVIGVGMALAAIQLASRGSERRHRTFGLYRLEILAALANAVLLAGVAAYVLVEAIRRFGDAPDVDTTTMLVVAGLGLVANLVAFALLRAGSKESVNVEGAYLEVLSDTLGSLGVIAAALVMSFTEWWFVDPAVAIAIGVWILPRAFRLAGRALRIVMQSAPPGLDLDAVAGELAAIDGVVDVHDLHVWTLTSDMEVASAHLRVADGSDSHGVLDEARHLLHSRYRIDHATLQIEPISHTGCSEVAW
jgi:cobalt-zinc-cadmium efflux system protein